MSKEKINWKSEIRDFIIVYGWAILVVITAVAFLTWQGYMGQPTVNATINDVQAPCNEQRYYIQNVEGGEIFEYLFINNTRFLVTDDLRTECGWEKYESNN